MLTSQTMGDEWWCEKLRRYKEVRRKMVATGRNIDVVAAEEMRRFAEDEARNKRIEERSKQIKGETSAIKKIILQARQIVDELN